MNCEGFIAECKHRYERGEDFESLIRYLRVSGCSKIESIATIAKGCCVGLGRAKELVHLSPIWQDRRDSDDQFHATVAHAASRLKLDE